MSQTLQSAEEKEDVVQALQSVMGWSDLALSKPSIEELEFYREIAISTLLKFDFELEHAIEFLISKQESDPQSLLYKPKSIPSDSSIEAYSPYAEEEKEIVRSTDKNIENSDPDCQVLDSSESKCQGIPPSPPPAPRSFGIFFSWLNMK